MRSFRALRPGDAVAVVAPSSPIRQEMLEEGLGELRRLGFEPVVGEDVAARDRFTAGTAERRLEELRRALADPGIRGIWCARGGYGLTPLLSELDPGPLRGDPKPILGESDATALGCWALAAGVAWVHGPMVAASLRRGSAGYEPESLRAALEARPHEAVAGRALRAGSAEGLLWGGCLSLLAALAGTPWLPRPEEPHLLLVEDVGVKPYQVDRMLVQLRDAGALEGLAGVVLGDFSDCVQHPEQGYEIDEVLADRLPGVPVTIGWPVGHADAPHLSLVLGRPALLEVPEQGPSRLISGRAAAGDQE